MGFAGALHQLTLHRTRAKERLIIPANFHCKDYRSLHSKKSTATHGEILIPTLRDCNRACSRSARCEEAESGDNLIRDGSRTKHPPPGVKLY